MQIPHKHRVAYAIIGGILALGAPLGSLLWRLVLSDQSNLIHHLLLEWGESRFFYIYMTLSTALAFAAFGYILGKKSDVLETQKTTSDRLAITDGLTDLYNHRFLQEHLSSEIQRAQRYHQAFTCLMLDIDNFKNINDDYGHPYGDEVLRVVSRILKEQVRRVDIVGRYGGEEFLIVMPQTTAHEVLPVADRILAEVQDYPFHRGGKPIRVTLSAGMATFDPESKEPLTKDGLLRAADEALYEAKRAGKNRTKVSGHSTNK